MGQREPSSQILQLKSFKVSVSVKIRYRCLFRIRSPLKVVIPLGNSILATDRSKQKIIHYLFLWALTFMSESLEYLECSFKLNLFYCRGSHFRHFWDISTENVNRDWSVLKAWQKSSYMLLHAIILKYARRKVVFWNVLKLLLFECYLFKYQKSTPSPSQSIALHWFA